MTPRPLRTENLTAPVLFRLVDQHQPTLLLDEVDSYLTQTDELRRRPSTAWPTLGVPPPPSPKPPAATGPAAPGKPSTTSPLKSTTMKPSPLCSWPISGRFSSSPAALEFLPPNSWTNCAPCPVA